MTPLKMGSCAENCVLSLSVQLSYSEFLPLLAVAQHLKFRLSCALPLKSYLLLTPYSSKWGRGTISIQTAWELVGNVESLDPPQIF